MQRTGSSTRPRDPRGDAATLVALAALAAIVAFAFRFLSHDRFTNDHYVHLSLAQALLLGDRPIRDYTDAGSPLMAALSAGAQLLVGRNLLAEVILTVGALSVAAAVTCWATGRITGSPMLGLLAALVQIAVFPRLYGYPTIFLYPILFLIGWAYLRRPSLPRLLVLGVWTACAFLLRRDHGLYSAIGGGAAVLIAHWPEGWRRVWTRGALYVLVTLLWASPDLAYVQRETGLVAYFRTSIAVNQAEAGRADRILLPALTPIRRGLPFVIRPRAAENLPSINVRWRRGLPDAARLGHERALGLRYPEIRDDGESWRYRVDPPATLTLTQLVSLRDVADTSGFDRRTLEFENLPSLGRRMLFAWNLDRIALGPPLEDTFNGTNSTTFVFYALWGLPLLALVVWLLRRRSGSWPPSCGPEVLLLAAMAMPTVIGLVRSPNQTRVPDGFGLAPILAAWVIAAMVTARPRFAATRGILKVVAVAAGVFFMLAVSSMAGLREKIDRARLREPGAILEQARDVVRRSSRWPWVGEWPAGGGADLVPYLNRCTTAEDRVLVLWNAPGFNVFSRRAFAGGEVRLIPAFRPTDTYEPAVLATLQRQRVPIVLADVAVKPDFDAAYPGIASFLARRYSQARVFSYEGGQRIALFVDRERPPDRLDRQFNLPCFAP